MGHVIRDARTNSKKWCMVTMPLAASGRVHSLALCPGHHVASGYALHPLPQTDLRGRRHGARTLGSVFLALIGLKYTDVTSGYLALPPTLTGQRKVSSELEGGRARRDAPNTRRDLAENCAESRHRLVTGPRLNKTTRSPVLPGATVSWAVRFRQKQVLRWIWY
ncbi:hypothetical protein NDU88_005984 [Pleurodeles waltl]|uniref:Uncharacterized protein n=1 Tax=Pleurodeles waltl TaxID=8319 RepID=A0AAV7UMM2_PLEWA|nr:hypothetical protein NDU88_005984 [Pleurodeles waltl]